VLRIEVGKGMMDIAGFVLDAAEKMETLDMASLNAAQKMETPAPAPAAPTPTPKAAAPTV
jgi:hypothetical protein